jgi:DNA polymerase-3 subunit gamma/tau
VEAPLALYRRYRPETFAEVIGQDHVTEPLRAALANNRVNHAYLFSGPRGCGKTTSARILARALNCEKAPIADPCGECESCRDLARGGPGSIDVIEIDAASHGGVDDARDLREKAFYAPVKSRYKIYIIDEAHMVTTQGFNALLKLVEEPPPHLRFVFATTEPEKVLPTIRSRTHHYPFRLIPPRLLTTYLGQLCDAEGVAIEPAALPLVVRAGGGSARDTLSVLDQLLGGAGPAGVTYDLAAGLLGYTPDSLLDEVVDAFAARDGAGVFGVVDKVIETGQDPRRFTEDLLRRLRDLVIVTAVPDAPTTGLLDVAEDAGERLVAQAKRFGAIELSRAADLVASGLTEMRGATAPRLLLELILARVLLPGADDSSDGVLARLDRLERRIAIGGSAPAPAPAAVASAAAPPAAAPPAVAPAPSVTPVRAIAEAGTAVASSGIARAQSGITAARDAARAVANVVPGASRPSEQASGATSTPGELAPASTHVEQPVTSPISEPASASPSPAPVEAAPAAPAPAFRLGLTDVRKLWPDVVEQVKGMRRLTWMLLSNNAQVVSVDDRTLTLGFDSAGARDSFDKSGSGELLRKAAIKVVGHEWRIEAIIATSASTGSGVNTPAPAATSAGDSAEPAAPRPVGSGPADWVTEPPADIEPPEAPETSGPPEAAARNPAREAFEQSRQPGAAPQARESRFAADAGAHRDDPDVESGDLSGAELIQRELGATIIDEIRHD